MTVTAETLAEELARLTNEYHTADEHTKPEAWNLLADFAVGNAATISAALSALVEEKQVGVKDKQLLSLIEWAHETLYEINPNNYDHEEVCKLNDASVEVILGLAHALGEKHGKTAEWWERYRKEHPLPALVDVPAVESEPVAFHVRVKGWGEEIVFTEDGAHSLIKRLRRTKAVTGDAEIIPLYASPVRSALAPAPAGEDVVEAGKRFLKACGAYVDGDDIPDDALMCEYGDALEAFRAALSRKPSDAQTVGDGSTLSASGGEP